MTARPRPAETPDVRCAACGHPLTDRRERIEVDGAHEHVRENPHGHRYRFGCFDRAPGAVAAGNQTDEWTWFAGHRWQTAYCRGCGAHVGWAFLTNARRFWGLIADRVTPADDGAPDTPAPGR